LKGDLIRASFRGAERSPDEVAFQGEQENRDPGRAPDHVAFPPGGVRVAVQP